MKNIFTLLLCLGVLVASTIVTLAATYTYKCPKCGLIQQYDRPGFYKCPNDKWVLSKQ